MGEQDKALLIVFTIFVKGTAIPKRHYIMHPTTKIWYWRECTMPYPKWQRSATCRMFSYNNEDDSVETPFGKAFYHYKDLVDLSELL